MSLQNRRIQTASGTVHLLGKPGEGPTQVLFHGASGNAQSFAPLLGAFGGGDVWCPDLPGRGGSEGPPRTTAYALVPWALSLLDAMELPQGEAPILLGHSFGGAVALSLALAHPERVGGLVLISSGSRLKVAPAILEAVASSSPEAPFALDFAFGPGASAALKTAYGDAVSSVDPASALADWQACDAFDLRERLGEVRVPTLVLYGSADRLTPPKHQGYLVEGLPGAKGVALDGVGHMLPWEAPEAMVGAIGRWLGEVRG